MIALYKFGEISPIFLTVLLIIYLMIVELGGKKIRNALFPFVIVLVLVFTILAIISVYMTYINLK
jgi:hypothetical protein